MEHIRLIARLVAALAGAASLGLVSALLARDSEPSTWAMLAGAVVGALAGPSLWTIIRQMAAIRQMRPLPSGPAEAARRRAILAALEEIADDDLDHAAQVMRSIAVDLDPALDRRRAGGDEELAKRLSWMGVFGAVDVMHHMGDRVSRVERAVTLHTVVTVCEALDLDVPDRFEGVYMALTGRPLPASTPPAPSSAGTWRRPHL